MENSTSKSQILVVGATGFLGLEICKQLTSTGKKCNRPCSQELRH
jgi:nucleoside-diphosphate-sugar epimerase